MHSSRSLFTISLLTLIFPLLITAQGYDFGHPSPSLPTNSDPAPQYTPPNPVTSQVSYNADPAPQGGSYGSDSSASPSDPGLYVPPPSYVSGSPSQYIPSASPPSNPAYGPPPSKCKAPTYMPPPPNSNPPSYIPPPAYENGMNSSDPILSSPTSSSSSNSSTISNSTIPSGGATNTTLAGGTFSSLTSLSMTGGCACLAQATSITAVTKTYSFTVTSVLTEVMTETATVTVQTVNLVGVSVVLNVSTPLTTSPVSTTLVMSTVGVGLNSSSILWMSGGVANTTMGSRPTGVVVPPSLPSGVVPPVFGSLLSYAPPAPSGYSTSLSNSGEEGSSEDGSSSYWDSGEYEGDTSDNAGDVETGPWDLGSGSDSEDSGSESEEQSGGSSFLDWLLEILK